METPPDATRRVLEGFEALTGGRPEVVWAAPGRVNLIGEHTDYNGGWALPFAIDRVTAVAVRRRGDGSLRLWSAQEPGPVRVGVAAPGSAGEAAGWARYPWGAARALVDAGIDVPGADVVIDSDVPVGAGLSSSAALLLATAAALAALAGADLDPGTLAALCHRAETVHAGAPVGLLDHLAIAHARAGHASLIDFTALDITPVPLDIGPLAVVDTTVRHDHTAGGYRRRREECEAAARALGVDALRAATADAVESRLDGVLRRRARHVVSEDARVLDTAARLGAGADIGAMLTASHRSLCDDFEVSCPELDLVVDTALGAGASGARMTGGGFGGSAVVLGLAAGELAAALDLAFARAGWRRPAVTAIRAAAGPARLR